VTNGSNQIHANNQPIMSHDMVAVHNGIVTNVDGLWRENADLERKTQLDTEVLLALIRKNLLISNDIVRSIQSTYQVMEGAASLALVFKDFDIAVLCTNVGSLYIVCSPDLSFYIFASERYILKTLLSTNRHLRRYRQVQIQQICANTGVMINLRSMEKTNFSLIFQKTQEDFQSSDLTSVNRNRVITDISSTNEHNNN
jgi:glucosamine--fructose-6-phosphate aminotransferase (isomerizing)